MTAKEDVRREVLGVRRERQVAGGREEEKCFWVLVISHAVLRSCGLAVPESLRSRDFGYASTCGPFVFLSVL